MVVDLKKYFQSRDMDGREDTVEYELDLSGVELDGVKPFCAPVKVSARFRGFAGSAELTVKLLYTVSKPCDRCCETVNRECAREFSHTLVQSLSGGEDDDAYVVVPEERLDLDGLLQEDILLDMPSKFLCSPNCKGLCPVCGKNLNEGDCGCAQREVDPRFAALKELL